MGIWRRRWIQKSANCSYRVTRSKPSRYTAKFITSVWRRPSRLLMRWNKICNWSRNDSHPFGLRLVPKRVHLFERHIRQTLSRFFRSLLHISRDNLFIQHLFQQFNRHTTLKIIVVELISVVAKAIITTCISCRFTTFTTVNFSQSRFCHHQ